MTPDLPTLALVAPGYRGRIPRPWQAPWRAGLMERVDGVWRLTASGWEALGGLGMLAWAEVAAPRVRDVAAWPEVVS